jgi:hypothetical protein
MSEDFFIIFQKFEHNPDYENHLTKLKELSKGIDKGKIQISDQVWMPNFGPDPKLFVYETELKDWTEEDIFDFRFLRDLYFQGAVDNLVFCRLAAAHLSSLEEFSSNETLKKVHYILEEEEEPEADLISELVMSDNQQISTLGASLMFSFFDK